MPVWCDQYACQSSSVNPIPKHPLLPSLLIHQVSQPQLTTYPRALLSSSSQHVAHEGHYLVMLWVCMFWVVLQKCAIVCVLIDWGNYSNDNNNKNITGCVVNNQLEVQMCSVLWERWLLLARMLSVCSVQCASVRVWFVWVFKKKKQKTVKVWLMCWGLCAENADEGSGRWRGGGGRGETRPSASTHPPL